MNPRILKTLNTPLWICKILKKLEFYSQRKTVGCLQRSEFPEFALAVFVFQIFPPQFFPQTFLFLQIFVLYFILRIVASFGSPVFTTPAQSSLPKFLFSYILFPPDTYLVFHFKDCWLVPGPIFSTPEISGVGETWTLFCRTMTAPPQKTQGGKTAKKGMKTSVWVAAEFGWCVILDLSCLKLCSLLRDDTSFHSTWRADWSVWIDFFIWKKIAIVLIDLLRFIAIYCDFFLENQIRHREKTEEDCKDLLPSWFPF